MAPDAVRYDKEMAVTHAEFLRNLPNALPDGNYAVDGTTVVVADADRRLEIELGAEGVRQIALLKLPKTAVSLTFTGYDAETRAAVMERFDKAFQRAGG